MKPVLVVVNPASGGGRTAKRWPEVASVLAGTGLDCQAVFTAGPGDATRIARQGVREGRALIVAAGGDGTISETAAGFFADGKPVPCETRFGVLPTGTGGDLDGVEVGARWLQHVQHAFRREVVAVPSPAFPGFRAEVPGGGRRARHHRRLRPSHLRLTRCGRH